MTFQCFAFGTMFGMLALFCCRLVLRLNRVMRSHLAKTESRWEPEARAEPQVPPEETVDYTFYDAELDVLSEVPVVVPEVDPDAIWSVAASQARSHS
jgi:hypothetical protein